MHYVNLIIDFVQEARLFKLAIIILHRVFGCCHIIFSVSDIIFEKSSQFLKIPSLLSNVLLRYRCFHLYSTPNFLHTSSIKKSISLFYTHHLRNHDYHYFKPQLCSSLLYSLNTCRSLRTLKKIHAFIIVSNGHELPLSVVSNLVSLYVEFNAVDSSVSVLKCWNEPNAFVWNSSIKAHVNAGFVGSAFSIYKLMREKGVPHDSYTLPILNGLVVLLESGRRFADMIHCVAVRMGLELDVYFCNTMIEAYLYNGCFETALKMFGEMAHRDSVSWTTMISGYIGERNVGCAFGLFNEMRKESEPNAVTILVMLRLCSSVLEGRQIHGYATKSGFLADQSVKNSILKMYAEVGNADDAKTLFDEIDKRDVVSWNIMIFLYSSEGNTLNMIGCFRKIWNESKPSIETLTLLASGLAEAGNLSQVRQIHCLSIKTGLCDDILLTSLLDFYAKCADLEASAQLFAEVLYRNCITWGAMMSGFIENGYFKEAIELFRQMLAAGVQPMAENMRNLLLVYTHMGALLLGKSVHGYLIRNSFFNSNEENSSLETLTLNMYVRCGSICAARTCFDRILARDRVTWTSMIEGCAIHGKGFEALELFHQMVENGIEPNSVTFISLLSGCSHSGLLHSGCELFCSMKSRFGIDPDLSHYTCIVDLLGRFGKMKEALAIIVKLVNFPDSRIWGALLSASRVNEDQKLGKYAAERLFQLEPDNVGYHAVFSNVQASAEKWDVVEEVRSSMKSRKLTKHPGWSCLEAKGVFHGFVSGDRSHRRTDEIYDMMECLGRNTLELGNVPFNSFSL